MIKNFFAIAFFTFIISNSLRANSNIISQDTTLNQLLRKLEVVKDDSINIYLLNELGWVLRNSKPILAKDYVNEAIVLNHLHGIVRFKSRLLDSYNTLGLINKHLGEYHNAINNYLKGLRIAESNNDSLSQRTILNNIGYLYNQQTNIEKTKEFCMKALKLSISANDTLNMINSYETLGILYSSNKKTYKDGILYFEKSLHLERLRKNTWGIGVTLFNIACNKLDNGYYEGLLEDFEECLRIFRELNEDYIVAACLGNIGSLYIEYYRDYSQAIYYLNKSQKLAEESKFVDLQINIYDNLFKAYNKNKDYKNAIKFLELKINLSDTVLSESKIRIITELETKYQTEKKEQELLLQQKEIEVLEKDKKIKDYTLYGVLIIFILLIFAGFGWFRNYKNKRIVEENAIRYQLDLYIKEIELLKSSKGPKNIHETIKQNLNTILDDPLSERELEVFNELSKGKTNKEMGETLFVSVNTVKTHLKSIYEKLDVKNRTQAVKKVDELEKVG
ncbi:MAG: hypothetical protein COB15_02535 [Flavobacteriales bacterium]|nr:MAG: hypothetical protein COB15_02535 [Flavobacteriales bacterium]